MRAGTSCTRCGAVLATDQEYCLECGERVEPPAQSAWRAPLIGAAAALVVGVVLLVLVFSALRSDADDAAGPAIRQAATAPTAQPAGSDVAPPLPAEQPSP